MNTLKTIIVAVIVSALITAGGIWYYDQHYATKIAVIDMSGYIGKLKKEYLAGKLPKQELEKRLRSLSAQISKTNSSNTVLILKEVVVSGKVQDYTPQTLADTEAH
ncbi:MAG: hypothetical protein DRQ02_02965 [Candidatus Latescibacterota bacterium]|nr:MAG: hypothetical protein DRQ02_02965 [Candidatus Latescibacterota bacterium]RKY71412.1 MAG: hypothetical protein DRQ24_07465 [Candidatus Latescibacterota bacterium]